LDVTLEEMQVLSWLKKDGKLTQKKLAELIGKSERTVKRITASLEENGLIERIGGKRFGYWKVNAE
jgi:DNA-binding MarR family transcriptional regulator